MSRKDDSCLACGGSGRDRPGDPPGTCFVCHAAVSGISPATIAALAELRARARAKRGPMMETCYELEGVRCVCPVDGSLDTYAVRVEARRLIPVEAIIAACKRITEGAPAFQEAITAALARELKARVTTTGTHSLVRTTVVCGAPGGEG